MLSMKWNIDKMTLLNLSGSFSAMKGTNGSDSRQATYNEIQNWISQHRSMGKKTAKRKTISG